MNQDITVKYFRYDKSNVAVFEKKKFFISGKTGIIQIRSLLS